MYKCYIDLTDINDSMELDSRQIVAELTDGEYSASLEVNGEVRVTYNGTTYKCASQMPEELIKMFHNGNFYKDVYVDMNNWFEVFIDKNGKWTGYSDVCDCEGMNPTEIEGFLKDCIDVYIKEE